MNAHSLRRGNVILHNGQPHRIMEFIHRSPGNKRAFVQTKMRNIITGTQTEARFSSTEEVELADVFYTKATYLYKDGDLFYFMKGDTFDQFHLTESEMGDVVYYLQEQMEVDVTEFNGAPIGIVPPKTVILTVEDTPPDMKGATQSGSPKPAKTDTGLSLNVPPFINIGDRVVVNTEEGTFVKRAD